MAESCSVVSIVVLCSVYDVAYIVRRWVWRQR